MPHEKEMNELDSLHIIKRMIATAKNEQKDDGQGWIIWGWMLFFASILTVANISFHWFKSNFIFWNMFGLITLLIALYKVIVLPFKRKRKKVKTYTHEIFEKLNVGFFICLAFIIVSMNLGVSPFKGFPLLMNLYGFWILIYATVLDFKPSKIGAFIIWALAFAALFAQNFSIVMILHAVGVLFGYIIPGHIANKNFKQYRESQSSYQ